MRVKKTRFPYFATLFTCLAAIILLGLGTWQVYRLDWKNELISNLAVEYNKDATRYPLDFNSLLTIEDNDLRRGFIIGQFDFSKEITVGPRRYKGKFGYDVVTPFRLQGGGTILVDRGWMETSDSILLNRKKTWRTGKVSLIGTARTPKVPWKFGPRNAPSKNLWIYLDPDEIAFAKDLPDLLPVVFYMDETVATQNDRMISSTERVFPNNNHLMYAVFWYSMAFVLLYIYYLRFWKNR